jgi:hypothetical protein
MRKCLSLAFDCTFAFVILSLLIVGLVSFTRQVFSEKSLSRTGTGMHLLSCPELFDTKENQNEDANQRLNNIHLRQDLAEKLLSKLQLSLEHARYVHTGKRWFARNDNLPGTDKALRVHGNEDIDINIPRKGDNKMLCETLKEILNNRIGIDQDSDKNKDDEFVTISITQLDDAVNKSMFLRGSRWIHKVPMLERILKVMDVSNSYDNFVKSVDEIFNTKLDRENINYSMIN